MEHPSSDWLRFALVCYPAGGIDCPCVVCCEKRALEAWARGEHETRPPDSVLREVILRDMERR